jgi:hypothetical protein
MKMNHGVVIAALAGALLAGPAVAAETGQIAAFMSKVDVDDEVAGQDDGTGFGVRGQFGFGGPFAHFEYQAVTLDDSDLDVNELRIGGGMSGELNKQFQVFGKAEYVDLGSDIELDGFGVHGGVRMLPTPQVQLAASVGYLMLGGELDDVSGLELDLNATFKFNRQFGGFFGYRTWMGSFDDAGTDFEVSDLRVGAVMFLGR